MTDFHHDTVTSDSSLRSGHGRSHFSDSEMIALTARRHADATGEIINLGTRIPIRSYEDIVRARQTGRFLALKTGFSANKATIVATAISELARNIILYARTGEIVITTRTNKDQTALLVTALDEGPGIPNITRAMASGYSTSGGMGVGLSGVRNMADDFEIRNREIKGTEVNVTILLS